MSDNINPTIGDVYLMKFEGNGSEQYGWRPGVVFQNNVGNAFSPSIIALPLTSSIKKLNQPTHVFLSATDTGITKDSIVLCENPERISKAKLGKFITKLSNEQMKEIAAASLLATAAVSFLGKDDMLEIWQTAVRLNSFVA